MTATQYCSVQEVLDFLNYTREVPDYDNQSSTNETLSGTTSTGYFLAHNKVISNSYNFYTGTGTTLLTETTDYAFDKDKGFLTLTASGTSAVGVNSVYGAYKYNVNFKDSMISSTIDSNTVLIDSILHMTYQTPTVVVREENPGKGAYYRMYSLDKFPKLPYIGQLANAITASSTTALLYDVTGLMDGDYITCESDVMLISDVDTTTNIITFSRSELNSTAAIHAADVFLCNYVVEIANTPLGGQPLWHTLGFRNNFDVDKISGNVQLLHVNAEDKDALASDLYPPQRIFNRIRVTYKYGANSVPNDIKRLAILMTVRQLYQAQIANAISRGINGFKPEGMSLIDKEIKELIRQNIRLMMDGF
jgi:hypothetical protein